MWGFEIDKVENWAYMDGVFTPEECKKIIEIGNAKEKHQATISDEQAEMGIDEGVRKNKSG